MTRFFAPEESADLDRRADRDEEAREARALRRADSNECRCGFQGFPGRCPGWQLCPLQEHDESEES